MKQLLIEVSPELMTDVKIQVAKEGKSIKEYVTELIKSDLAEKNKNNPTP